MSGERLSDERLAWFQQRIDIQRDVVHPDVLARSAFASRIDYGDMEAMLTEIKQRRAADLTPEDREALAFARRHVEAARHNYRWLSGRGARTDSFDTALSILDRLLAGGGK